VFLTKDNVVKLGDLGSACTSGTLQVFKTKAGTPMYLAPEIVRDRDYDYKIDVWGLG
jgi:serine/threonine protein kinase